MDSRRCTHSPSQLPARAGRPNARRIRPPNLQRRAHRQRPRATTRRAQEQRRRLRLRLQSHDRDARRRDRQPELVASVVHAVQREGIGAVGQRRDLDVQPAFAVDPANVQPQLERQPSSSASTDDAD